MRLDLSDTTRAFQQLRRRGPQAIARALNRSIASARTAMGRAVAADMGLKVGDAHERIGLRLARPDQPVAQLTASGKRLPLMDFGAKGSRRGGVIARLPGGKGRYPHAFIRQMRNGHTGVFMRAGKARLPIHELHGPSIARVFEKHVDVGITRGREQLAKNLAHEFRFALRADT